MAVWLPALDLSTPNSNQGKVHETLLIIDELLASDKFWVRNGIHKLSNVQTQTWGCIYGPD